LKRKIILLNMALAVLICAACWQLRVQWLAARQHEAEVLRTKPKPVAALPYNPPPAPQPVMPAQYLDVAAKDLFVKDRNPNVIVKPPPPPPPPKPMPALPVVKGILNIEGITAIMTESGKSAQKEIRPGDQIGEFKLLAISNQEIVLEWDGQEVRRPVEELFDHSAPEPAPAAAAQNTPAAAQPNKPAIVQKASGPGVDIGAGRKSCVPGDTTPVGTIVDGLKKTSWETPFGQGCAWEAPR
jgi:hypothetical protein